MRHLQRAENMSENAASHPAMPNAPSEAHARAALVAGDCEVMRGVAAQQPLSLATRMRLAQMPWHRQGEGWRVGLPSEVSTLIGAEAGEGRVVLGISLRAPCGCSVALFGVVATSPLFGQRD
jgi:hypothetical protein